MSLWHSAGLHGQPVGLPGWHSLILCHGGHWRGLCSKGVKLGFLGFDLIPSFFQLASESLHLSLLALSKFSFSVILLLFALQFHVAYPQPRIILGSGCSQLHLQLLVLSLQFSALCEQLLCPFQSRITLPGHAGHSGLHLSQATSIAGLLEPLVAELELFVQLLAPLD